jgi:hypothetical protein
MHAFTTEIVDSATRRRMVTTVAIRLVIPDGRRRTKNTNLQELHRLITPVTAIPNTHSWKVLIATVPGSNAGRDDDQAAVSADGHVELAHLRREVGCLRWSWLGRATNISEVDAPNIARTVDNGGRLGTHPPRRPDCGAARTRRSSRMQPALVLPVVTRHPLRRPRTHT